VLDLMRARGYKYLEILTRDQSSRGMTLGRFVCSIAKPHGGDLRFRMMTTDRPVADPDPPAPPTGAPSPKKRGVQLALKRRRRQDAQPRADEKGLAIDAAQSSVNFQSRIAP